VSSGMYFSIYSLLLLIIRTINIMIL
jgi:hypothetical protein